ncbi:MAG: hypothetical protein ABSB09_15195 [Acidimicrobiales bacterium]
MTTVETGFDGRLAAGPSTLDGVVVVHTGLISEAVGAAGLPGICGDVPVPEPVQTATVTTATATSVATVIAIKAFPDGNPPDAR